MCVTNRHNFSLSPQEPKSHGYRQDNNMQEQGLGQQNKRIQTHTSY